MISKILKTGKMEGFMRTEGYEQEDVTVNCQDGGSPKVGEKSPKVGSPFEKDHCGPFEKGNCRFVFLIQKRAYFV